MERKITIHLTLDQLQAIKDCLNHIVMLGDSHMKLLADRGSEGLNLEEPETESERALAFFHAPDTQVWAAPDGDLGNLLMTAVGLGLLTIHFDKNLHTHRFELTDKGRKARFNS